MIHIVQITNSIFFFPFVASPLFILLFSFSRGFSLVFCYFILGKKMGHETPEVNGERIAFRNSKRKSRKEVDYDDNPTRMHYVGCGACTCNCLELKNKRFKALPRT
jgi:hypothetical protein